MREIPNNNQHERYYNFFNIEIQKFSLFELFYKLNLSMI